MIEKLASGSKPFWVQKLLRNSTEKLGATHQPWSTGFAVLAPKASPKFRRVCNQGLFCWGFESKEKLWLLSAPDLTHQFG